ncbi:MAG: hypothetical protein U9N02_01025, partial [Campylobacterota bacterium]|nr:hypothetical protein [Campylobacterota bacterium]
MKSFIFILLLSSLTQLFALTGTELILSEIRNQREDMRDMKKEIINIRADMKDIRTDMKDIRTDMKILREDVNFRLNFIQNLLYALMGLIFVSLFIA